MQKNKNVCSIDDVLKAKSIFNRQDVPPPRVLL